MFKHGCACASTAKLNNLRLSDWCSPSVSWWMMLRVDRNKAKAMGIQLSDIFATLQTQMGSLYVNDFTRLFLSRQYQYVPVK